MGNRDTAGHTATQRVGFEKLSPRLLLGRAPDGVFDRAQSGRGNHDPAAHQPKQVRSYFRPGGTVTEAGRLGIGQIPDRTGRGSRHLEEGDGAGVMLLGTR